jgi:hypothetical protein
VERKEEAIIEGTSMTGTFFLFPFEVAVCLSAAQVPGDFTNTCAVAAVLCYES